MSVRVEVVFFWKHVKYNSQSIIWFNIMADQKFVFYCKILVNVLQRDMCTKICLGSFAGKICDQILKVSRFWNLDDFMVILTKKSCLNSLGKLDLLNSLKKVTLLLLTYCYYFLGHNTCYSSKPSNQQQNGGSKASCWETKILMLFPYFLFYSSIIAIMIVYLCWVVIVLGLGLIIHKILLNNTLYAHAGLLFSL